MKLRGYAIIALDALDHWALRHRVYWFCHAVAQSSWWDYVPSGHPYHVYWAAKWAAWEADDA